MITKTNQSSVKVLTLAYDANGRTTNRWSVAKGDTRYVYDGVGNLTLVDYPSGTADITNQFNALNRLTSMIDGAGTTAFTYNTAGDLTGEDGPWANDTVTRGYHSSVPHLRASLVLQRPNASDWTQSYGYDLARRLTNITSGAGVFSYAYRSGASELIDKLTLANTSYITNTYDSVGRQLSTILKNSGNTNLNSHAYLYDLAGQRTKQTLTSGNYWNYGYDPREQLTVARGYESGGGTARNQEQFLYAYDAAANLTTRSNNALGLSFTLSNPRNELTSASRAGTLTVAGYTSSTATSVTVADNGNAAQAAARYSDGSFARTNVTVLNGNNTFTAVATDALGRGDTNAITLNLPASLSFTYDSNGNLTGDGRRTLTYDAENQLTNVTVTNGVNNSTKSEFVYDGLRRLRVTKEYLWTGSAFTLAGETRRVYDGRLVVQERDANNIPVITYKRGIDLSGTLDGAGGIGGMLARTDHANGTTAYYHADGNGNVTLLINASQQPVARYSYDPFGNMQGKSGSLADANVYRSSSKEWHERTGLVYYGFRFYDPSLQRWVNQDPLGEEGGINLYQFVGSDPVNGIDPWGLQGLFDYKCNAAENLPSFPSTRASYGRPNTSVPPPLPPIDWSQVTFDRPFPLSEPSTLDLVLLGIPMPKIPLRPLVRSGPAPARQLGRAGEEAAGVFGPKTRIQIPGTDRFRIPDRLTPTTLTEVKNVKALNYTQQLRDYTAYSRETGRAFELFVRPTTQLSGPLQQAISCGQVIIRPLPIK